MPKETTHNMAYRPGAYNFFSDSTLTGTAPPGLTPRGVKMKSFAYREAPTLHVYTDKLLVKGELTKEFVVENQPPERLITKVFPDEVLPKPVSTMFAFLKTNLSATNPSGCQFDETAGEWKFFDKAGFDIHTRVQATSSENKFASFANRLGNAIASFPNLGFDTASINLLTGVFSTLPVMHTISDLNRKPDVIGANAALLYRILMRRGDGAKISWPNIKFIIELKLFDGTTVLLETVHTDIANKVWAMFDQQPDRRFIPSLALLGFSAYFSVWNRAGVVHAQHFNINQQPELFLRIMMGFLFASDAHLGFDPTMYLTKNPSGPGVWRIRTREGEYEFVESLWTSNMIQGRGTWCWVVRKCDTGELFVMKDSWVLANRWPDEPYFFRKANDKQVAHIPTMRYMEDVEVSPGVKDSTDEHRGEYSPLENRYHCRIFFLERGRPLREFRSKREYLKAFIASLIAHGELEDKAHILHRDISDNNILISDDGGLLIDLDYAYDLKLSIDQQTGPRGIRTGTPPFMAAEILLRGSIPHQPRFDFESFFYVLIYGCAIYPRAGVDELKDDQRPEFLEDWFHPPSASNLGRVKKGELNMDLSLWRETISDSFLPYWNFLKNSIWRVKEKLKVGQLTRKEFIDILQDTLDHLPEDDDSTDGDELTMPDGTVMPDPTIIPSTDIVSDGYETPTPAPRASSKRRAENLDDGNPSPQPQPQPSIMYINEGVPKKKRSRTIHTVDVATFY